MHFFKGNSCIVSVTFFSSLRRNVFSNLCYGKVKLVKIITGFILLFLNDTQLSLWEYPTNVNSIYIVIIDSNDGKQCMGGQFHTNGDHCQSQQALVKSRFHSIKKLVWSFLHMTFQSSKGFENVEDTSVQDLWSLLTTTFELQRPYQNNIPLLG